MRLIFVLFSFLILSFGLYGQPKVLKKYWVTFTDKNNNPYSIHRPYEFLSSRALDRRARQGISVTPEDLPVTPSYIFTLREKGAKIYNKSRWFNAATISITEEKLPEIEKLDFVKSIEYVGKYKVRKRKDRKPDKDNEPFEYEAVDNYYGYAFDQIAINNGHILHALGYEGTGILVAVLDGGFTNAYKMPFFDSLQAEGRLIGGPDFVEGDNYNFEGSHHGSQVLSVMSASLPGLMVGTAPGATYVTVKTEDTKGEYVAEECSWVAGVEYADSLGADIINSSLGYTTFNDSSMNYSYKDLDGRKSRASIAANKAYERGMIVVNSAGNSGDSKWKYIGAPADAQYVMSIAGISRSGRRAGFSSFGPTPDGRIKPTVAALGQAVTVASVNSNNVTLSNGTSFASPIIAGLNACLRQAFPDLPNDEIVQAIEESAHLSTQPDEELGYGIPDYFKAYVTLAEETQQISARADRSLSKEEENILPGTLFFHLIQQKIYLPSEKLPEGKFLTVYPDGSFGPIREVFNKEKRLIQP